LNVDGGDTGAEEADAPATITLRGRTIELPPGVEPETVRQIMTKRRNGQDLSASEQQLMQRIFQDAGTSKPDEGDAPDYRFGGDFWVVADEDGVPRIVNVRAGLTDLDRVEIISGLGETDKVLLLPSAHLVETQERLQSFITRRVGGVPGIR